MEYGQGERAIRALEDIAEWLKATAGYTYDIREAIERMEERMTSTDTRTTIETHGETEPADPLGPAVDPLEPKPEDEPKPDEGEPEPAEGGGEEG